MISVTLPDGSQRQYDAPLSALEVAKSIGSRLAQSAVGAMVDGKPVDLSYVITQSCALQILTPERPEGLEIIRHSAAHLLAQAVQRIYPKAQVTIGPVIEDGFFYDFAFERPFTPEDLVLFEAEMQKIIKEDLVVTRKEMTRNEAIALFKKMGEAYKVEILESIPETEVLSFYQQGDFIDLCRGPHVPRTGLFKAVKLLKVAGAYWRGDSNNAMLTRVYGTAWAKPADQEAYLTRLEEAEKRDHRKIAKKLDLFHLQEEAPGMVFWHPKGWTIYSIITQYMADIWRTEGYQEVRTPQVIERSLWEKSGHWAMFQQNMFCFEQDEKAFAIKPMNCPAHIQIYNQHLKSYRDLPLRLAEFGSCHRYEASGALHGCMRVRQFTQDDAHIFCTEDQIQAEVSQFIALLYRVYRDFGLEDILIRLATRPAERVGSDALWDKAEKALEQALVSNNLSFEWAPGEGAFYGPKLEFSLKDCLGRIWQCGTIQVDPSMPARLGAEYVDEQGNRVVPIMLHRAILGTLERFIGILLEHYAGALPLWLAPVQVVIANITDRQASLAQIIAKKLQNRGVRVITDLRNEKIGFKIREHSMDRVPYVVILGDQEEATNTMSLRTRDGVEQKGLSFEDFCNLIDKISKERKHYLLES